MHGTIRLYFIVYEINSHHVKAVGGALLPHAALPEQELLGVQSFNGFRITGC
jgi:hypothetical protein